MTHPKERPVDDEKTQLQVVRNHLALMKRHIVIGGCMHKTNEACRRTVLEQLRMLTKYLNDQLPRIGRESSP